MDTRVHVRSGDACAAAMRVRRSCGVSCGARRVVVLACWSADSAVGPRQAYWAYVGFGGTEDIKELGEAVGQLDLALKVEAEHAQSPRGGTEQRDGRVVVGGAWR
jgi:hypothetical protein